MRLSCVVCVGLLATTLPGTSARAGSIEQHLRDEYRGKTLLLRNFPTGSHLAYDTAGALINSSPTGDWTVAAAVRVDKVEVSRKRIRIEGSRIYFAWVKNVGFSPIEENRDEKKKKATRALRIDADLPSDSRDDADSLMSRIFLNSHDDFAALVPEYWKPCVRAALVDVEPQKPSACEFSPQFLKIPGVALHSEKSNDPTLDPAVSLKAPMKRLEKGIKPPKVTHNREPEFDEEARQAKFQGVITLLLQVDASGMPRNIRIQSPLGCGLDKRAVEAVSEWEFEPATLDGTPIAFDIAVEVDFHLY